jgi:hypothetical protein
MSIRFHQRLRTRRLFPIATGAITALVFVSLQSRAAEQITLRNGFALQCDHHAQVDGHIRVYLSPGEDNYIELGPSEIVTFETILDPPRPVVPTSAPQPAAPAKLTMADLREMLARAGATHNLDVDLLASVVKAESDGNAHAVSHAGAEGLMQLMPATAADLGVHDRFQPEQNVGGGSAYLDALLVRYHDNLALALAAYNAGPQAVAKYHGIPPYHETRVYVARVIHEFNRRVLARTVAAHQIDAPASASSSPGIPTH